MKTKHLLFATTAILAFAGCTSNDFVGDQTPQGSNNTNGAISFNLSTAAITRAGGATAATALDNQFIVWGEKNESGGTAVSVPSANSVFPNYQVNWVDLAQSTTSNSSGWEYVGYTHSNTTTTDDYQGNISPSLSEAQTIKYWDMSATNYVFTAVSALKNDIKTGKVRISKILSGTNEYAKGYTITVTNDANFNCLYFSDRNKMTTGYGTSPVTMNFRNLLSQIRMGMYETIPGYDVSAIKFYGADFTDGNEFKVSSTSSFGATVDNLKPGANTLTITYNSENKPVVSTSGASATTITLGQNFNTLSTTNVMAKTSAVPTWETDGGAYTQVFPREGVTTDMTLKVKYTLYNSTSGETIDVNGTVLVPSEYLQWKPNFKYSYIFKLTDDALKPITFDAVQIETETGYVEYITTVDDQSITTYQNGTLVTTSNEYVSSKPIYVVVGEGALLTVGTNAKLYLATNNTGDGTVPEITENSVSNALANGVATDANSDSTNDTWTVTGAGMKSLIVTTIGIPTLTAISSIPAADSPTGADITIYGAKFTPTAAGYYVFEYTDGSANKHYKVIKVVAAPAP